MNEPLRIFGIDPGTHFAGYGVIDSYNGDLNYIAAGTIRGGKKTDPIASRLAKIYCELELLIKEHRPHVAALEQAFYGKSIEASIRLGEGRGIALLCAQRNGVAIAEYSPALVKKSVVGFGRADKSQVAAMVQNILQLKTQPNSPDAADALAIAICHGHRLGQTNFSLDSERLTR